MRSPTSSEDARLVMIVVLCAQTRLPGPWSHRDAFSRFDKPAWQATEPRAKREAMSVLCHGLVVDSMFKQSKNVAIAR